MARSISASANYFLLRFVPMICWVCFLKITDSATGNEDFVLDSTFCDSNLRLIPNLKDGEEEIYTRDAFTILLL
ncbi:hypothetical protein SLE2022_000450 [Rubroshorea leprosula]